MYIERENCNMKSAVQHILEDNLRVSVVVVVVVSRGVPTLCVYIYIYIYIYCIMLY